LKELGDVTLPAVHPPHAYADSNQDRVLAATRTAWARPDADPLWGVSSWFGFPCQVRTESSAFKTIRVKRMVAALGPAAALSERAATLGAVLARVHAAPDAQGNSAAHAIAAAIAVDPRGFADEQADVGEVYAKQVLADAPRFTRALEDLGPTLGVV